MLAYDPADPDGFSDRLEPLARDPDPRTAAAALHWLCQVRENAGDATGALEAAERALALLDEDDGAWQPAMLRTQIAQLAMQLGNSGAAIEHARAALKEMRGWALATMRFSFSRSSYSARSLRGGSTTPRPGSRRSGA